MSKRELMHGFQRFQPQFQEAMDLVSTHVRYLLWFRRLIPPNELQHRVIGRVKSAESLAKKVRKVEREKKISLQTWAQIRKYIDDIAGIRVVCNYLDELVLVYGYIQRHPAFREMPGKFVDYVYKPKFGYRALHTVIAIETTVGLAKCEIQIRTALQDAWAVKSHALVYKLKKADIERLPRPIRNLLVQQSDMLYNMDQTAGELSDLIRHYLRGNTA